VAVPVNPSALVVVGIAALIAWRMYSRMRRLIGRQRLSKVRPWLSVTLFPALVLLLGFAALANPEGIAALAAGLVAGAALGTWGLKLTRFERTPEGLFYTPNMHLGIALSLLLAGRILYRLGQVYLGVSAGGTSIDFARSPITLVIFGTLAGYYVRYAIGLIAWRRAGDAGSGLVAQKIGENAEVGRGDVAHGAETQASPRPADE